MRLTKERISDTLYTGKDDHRRDKAHGKAETEKEEVVSMAWIIIGAVMIILLAAEACFIIPDKMPWNRRKRK